jgi:transcriptional regulator with XRE-family HTH domain
MHVLAPEVLGINFSCNYPSCSMASDAAPESDTVDAQRAAQVAERIRSARAAMNISRKEFEQRYHLGRNTMAKVESDDGHPTMAAGTRHKLEDAFGWDRGQIDRWMARGVPAPRAEPAAQVVIDSNSLLELAHVMGLAKKFSELPQRFAEALEDLVDVMLVDRARG